MWMLLFFGGLWGLLEATLGYVLHISPLPIAGIILFPIGGMIMVKAHQSQPNLKLLGFIGVVAAAIKAVNFLLPGIFFKTFNPMMAILIQAVVLVIAVPMLNKKGFKGIVLPSLFVAFAWRGIYLLYLTGMFISTAHLSPHLSSVGGLLNFLVLQGTISGVLLILGLNVMARIETKPTWLESKYMKVLAPATVSLAILLTLIL